MIVGTHGVRTFATPSLTATWKGSGLTQIATVTSGNSVHQLFYLDAPTSGTDNVTIGQSGFGGFGKIMGGVTTYKGTLATTPI